jgi:hypothetical protein
MPIPRATAARVLILAALAVAAVFAVLKAGEVTEARVAESLAGDAGSSGAASNDRTRGSRAAAAGRKPNRSMAPSRLWAFPTIRRRSRPSTPISNG